MLSYIIFHLNLLFFGINLFRVSFFYFIDFLKYSTSHPGVYILTFYTITSEKYKHTFWDDLNEF